jgi:RNA polymerase sigma factor (sigma-70 family)
MESSKFSASSGEEPVSARRGDAQAHNPGCAKTLFIDIVMPYLDDAYDLARWLTGSKTDAQDVVQTASLRALRGIESLSSANARAWLLAIVRNTAYDWLRKNRSSTVIFTDDLCDRQRAEYNKLETATPEAMLIEKEDRGLLQSAIGALPMHHRETLMLRELKGFSYREIAVLTGTSIGTTMSRLYRARRQLAAQLRENHASDAVLHG